MASSEWKLPAELLEAAWPAAPAAAGDLPWKLPAQLPTPPPVAAHKTHLPQTNSFTVLLQAKARPMLAMACIAYNGWDYMVG